MTQPDKLFIVRKYVKARSAEEAIRKERGIAPDESFLDEEWRKANLDASTGKVMGIQAPRKTKRSEHA